MLQIFRTGQLYKVEMADSALNEAQVPHFLREETSSGLRVAMPVAPSMGPGTWWVILVPEECADEARKILSELPFEITINPDVLDFQPPGRSRRAWQIWLRILAIAFFAFVLYQMIAAVLRTL